MYAKVENNVVVSVGNIPASYKGENPFVDDKDEYTIGNFNTSFSDSEYKEFGYLPVVGSEQPNLQKYEYIDSRNYIIGDDSVTIEWVVKEKEEAEMWRLIREERNDKLRQSDVVLARFELSDNRDTAGDKAEILSYRKSLFDITELDSNPRKIVFPKKPSFIS